MTSGAESLARLDALLVAHHHHALTPWWRAEAEAFYGHPTAREWVLRVGRGGAKSFTATKFALHETLFGGFDVPRGERHYFAFVSVRAGEAAERLRLIETMLGALGVKHTRSGDTIELASMPLGFKVFVASVGSVSGFRCIGWVADELSKWTSDDAAAEPAREVLASLRAMTVTHARARGLLVSSPLSTIDYHAELFADGTSERRYVSPAAPTWVANPAVTEDATHDLEPDVRVWAREYAAIPQAGRLGAFDADAIERCFRPLPEGLVRGARSIILDPSSGKADTWCWGVAGWDVLGDVGHLVFDAVDGIRGSFWSTVSGHDVVARVASAARALGCSVVHSDQRESLMLKAEFQKLGFTFREHPWTSASKPPAVETVRRLMSESRLLLPVHAELRRELLGFEERIAPTGQFTYGARGSGHDDFVALVITAAMSELQHAWNGELDWLHELDWRDAIESSGWGAPRC
jgi:hypothetical protein